MLPAKDIFPYKMGLRYRPYGRINTNVSSPLAREGRRGF